MPDIIRDEHHIARYVKWQQVRKDENDNPVGILGEAFRRREDEAGLSVCWIERAAEDPADQLAASIRLLAQRINITSKSRVAICNVGTVKETALSVGRKIRVVHAPSRTNTAHAEIRQLSRDEMDLLDLLARETVIEHHRCRDICPSL